MKGRKLEERCAEVLAMLNDHPDHWLDLGEVSTCFSERGFLRAFSPDRWEIFEEDKEGEIELGVDPKSIDLFGESGDFRECMRRYPRRRPRPIPRRYVERVADLDAKFQEFWSARADDGVPFRWSAQSEEVNVRAPGGEWWGIETRKGEIRKAWRLEEAYLLRRLRMEIWEKEAPVADHASVSLGKSLADLLDPEGLVGLLLAGRAELTFDKGEQFSDISFRVEEGCLVVSAWTGDFDEPDWENVPYVSDLGWPIYEKSPASEGRVRSLLQGGGEERLSGVAFLD